MPAWSDVQLVWLLLMSRRSRQTVCLLFVTQGQSNCFPAVKVNLQVSKHLEKTALDAVIWVTNLDVWSLTTILRVRIVNKKQKKKACYLFTKPSSNLFLNHWSISNGFNSCVLFCLSSVCHDAIKLLHHLIAGKPIITQEPNKDTINQRFVWSG